METALMGVFMSIEKLNDSLLVFFKMCNICNPVKLPSKLGNTDGVRENLTKVRRC